MEALIFLTVLGIIGLVSPRRWRLFIYPMMVTVLLFGVILSPPMLALASWGLSFSLPSDSGDVVDTIVVLGRGAELRERRVEVVNDLWKAKRSSYIFVSGMLDANEIIERLKEDGLPKQVLGGETCSETTEENAQFTQAILNQRKTEKILLVTDAPHMLRSLLVFRSFGFVVLPHPSALPSQWSTSKQMQVMLREYAALAHYTLTGRLKQRLPAELERPNYFVTDRLKSWKCQI